MCGQIFWKRIVVFCLTLGLGVLVAGFFTSKELPAQNVNQAVNPAPAENKNCVPVDENLQYQTLENEAPASPFQLEETPKLADSKKYEKHKTPKEHQKKREAIVKQPYYNPSKDSAEYKDLLHKEKCFDAAEKK
jgi:hypothetical protein